jgi:hypothetical protein
LQTCFAVLDARTLKSRLEKTNYTHALASWPRGLDLLMADEGASKAEDLIDLLWTSAQEFRNSESLLSLLPYKTKVNAGHWYIISKRFNDESNEIADEAERVRRGQLFDTLALRLSCDNVTPGISDLCTVDLILDRSPLYHSDILSELAAESAWKAGFRDLNSARGGVAACTFARTQTSTDMLPLFGSLQTV